MLDRGSSRWARSSSAHTGCHRFREVCITTPVLTIGEEIRYLRQQCRHREAQVFAAEVGISYEGLRKIENGERLPNRDTLEKILIVGNVPVEKANEVRDRRDQTQAERDGLALQYRASTEKLDNVAERAAVEVEKFLLEFEMCISKEDRKDLYRRMRTLFKEELSA